MVYCGVSVEVQPEEMLQACLAVFTDLQQVAHYCIYSKYLDIFVLNLNKSILIPVDMSKNCCMLHSDRDCIICSSLFVPILRVSMLVSFHAPPFKEWWKAHIVLPLSVCPSLATSKMALAFCL